MYSNKELLPTDTGDTAPENRLRDRFGRTLTYMRVSVTDRCNLKCSYCRPDGIFSALPHREILSYEELYRFIKIGVGMGLQKIRITGGEPLIRRGIAGFMAELSQMKGLRDLSITTNGIFLKHHLESLVSSGIKRINVSMDTLRRDRYRLITGFDGFHEAWEGIKQAEDMGVHPLKINMVVIRGVNDDEVQDMARLSIAHAYHIRFIEYMPIGLQKHSERESSLSFSEMKNTIESIGKLMPVPSSEFDGPARRYRFEDAKGEVGFISAMSDHFCRTCNRLRLTPSGYLKPCLLSDRKVDIKGPARNGATDQEIEQVFLNAVNRKPMEHLTETTQDDWVSDQMSSIGG